MKFLTLDKYVYDNCSIANVLYFLVPQYGSFLVSLYFENASNVDPYYLYPIGFKILF